MTLSVFLSEMKSLISFMLRLYSSKLLDIDNVDTFSFDILFVEIIDIGDKLFVIFFLNTHSGHAIVMLMRLEIEILDGILSMIFGLLFIALSKTEYHA